MQFRELTCEDIEFVKNNTISRGILAKLPTRTEFSYALEHEGKTLGIGGIHLITLTTAWAWVDMSTYAKDYLLTSYKTIKNQIENICYEHDIKRLQAFVECDFLEAILLVEHLGFQLESKMEKFIDDRDAYLYVKFTETING